MSHGVTFWTEGGASLGMGHVMRSINIARALDSLDVPSHFLVNNDHSVIERLDAANLYHLTCPMESGCGCKLSSGVVVIDTKKDVSDKVRLLKENGKKVVLIDNNSPASALADRVVVPSALPRRGIRRNAVSGRDYLIIGDNFRYARRRPEYSSSLKVLITMGGSDPNGLTEKVVEALWDFDGIEATVVIGPAARPTDRLEGLISSGNHRFRFLRNVRDMAPVMASSHLAFTAVGTTIYELAYMGVPSVLIANYPEDEQDLRGFEGLGTSLSLGYFRDVKASDIRVTLRRLQMDRAFWELMSTRGRSLTDGRGAQRIALLIESLTRDGENFMKASNGVH